MNIDPAQLSPSEFYLHLTRVILPRPIAWVSTRSSAGVNNLAPYSFFSGVGSKPPSILFCPANRRDGLPKDSLRNILETKEFVVNVVPFVLAEAMNQSAAEVPAETSEFELLGLEPTPSVRVQAPGVAESPVRLECRLLHHLSLHPGPGGANVVVGEVVHLYLSDAVLDDRGAARAESLDLIGRLGGMSYSTTRERFDLARPQLHVPSKS